ncbi:helix-turn-helix domain-containing protein [Streptomyces olivoreticuli]
MRLECVRLPVQGWTAPGIASIVDRHVVTVRKALHRFFGMAARQDGRLAGELCFESGPRRARRRSNADGPAL